jgi:uncharacterized low-complexity protein
MNKTQKTISLAIGSAFALSIAATTVNAAENPFALKSLSNGYQVAEHDTKAVDGKCSTGKCGANKKTADKAKEGACSADKMKDGACSAEMKTKQGSAEKAKDGSSENK